MFLLSDDLFADHQAGDQAQALAAKQDALDLLVAIGHLPAGRICDKWVAAYGFGFYNQPTAADVASVEFAAKDILLLSASERVAFVKGVARVLRHLAAAGHAACWCHQPATLKLTLTALATLVASGKAKRKQAFKAVNQVDWLCFKELFLGQGLGYEDWIKVLAQQHLGNTEPDTGDFAELERLAGARILEFIGETGQAF
jgi:hypothetical protein